MEGDDWLGTRDVVRTALLSLPDDHRDALLLRVEAGLSYEEIASMKYVSTETVRVWVHRARKEVARRLAGAER